MKQPFADHIADAPGIEIDQQGAAPAERRLLRLRSLPSLSDLNHDVAADPSVEPDPPRRAHRMHLDGVQATFHVFDRRCRLRVTQQSEQLYFPVRYLRGYEPGSERGGVAQRGSPSRLAIHRQIPAEI